MIWFIKELYFYAIQIHKEIKKMSAQMDKLTQDVAAEGTVIQSAITLLQGLSQQLKDAATDPVALQAVIDSIDNQTQQLAAAVTSNTPVVTPAPTV